MINMFQDFIKTAIGETLSLKPEKWEDEVNIFG
jgi:hypothetical protein